MPLLRQPYAGPYNHERRRAWPAALGALTALLVAGLIGWAIGHAGRGGTRTITNSMTTTATSPSVHQHTAQGAVAAAEASLVQAETSCLPGDRCQAPSAYSLGPDGGGLWSLAYQIKNYTGDHAVVEAWQLGIAAGGSGPSDLAWQLADVPVTWTGNGWKQAGQISTNPTGPSPPPNQSTGATSQSFVRAIASFWRFPGAP